MANINDYLDWRGDIPFSVDPFNEVDNLVLSALVYSHFGGLVPGPECKHSISMQKLHEQFFKKHKDEEFENASESAYIAPLLLHKLVTSPRFHDVKMTGYLSHTDEETQVQFACMTFLLPDGTNYVAFRGTDHTLVGWKEDFNMSFLYRTPGQVMAADYLNKNFKFTRRKLRLGGHSKGGNLAVYAGAFCNSTIQKKIIGIYSNDGPGFREEIVSEKSYQKILPIIHSIVPNQTIVSMLFESPFEPKVICSSADGLAQHNVFSWQIERNHFIEATGGLSDKSKMFQKTFQGWISELDMEKRQIFVDELFGLLASKQREGVLTIDDLLTNPTQTITILSKNIGEVKDEHQELFKEVLYKLVISGKDTMKDSFFDTVSKNGTRLLKNARGGKKRNDKKKK
ncbi:MAG: DUF2974 domain-containing protein [Lachnospiraceae bacterium]|nr:DUF2974 domain-containing protein [Lachnospiraceae bacterium]